MPTVCHAKRDDESKYYILVGPSQAAIALAAKAYSEEWASFDVVHTLPELETLLKNNCGIDAVVVYGDMKQQVSEEFVTRIFKGRHAAHACVCVPEVIFSDAA